MVFIRNLKTLRWISIVSAVCNLGLVLIGGSLAVSVSPSCPSWHMPPLGIVSLVALVRILYMVGAAKAQLATAATIIGETYEAVVATDVSTRIERRMRYRNWLWWTRLGMVVTTSQFAVALYVMYIIVKDISYSGYSDMCFLGQDAVQNGWKKLLMVSFLVLLWLVVIIQCLTGSDVLRWRSFYATHDTAWKAHYREVFDHGLREALCCMGRVKYLSVLEEDEVYSVARLLGDLVAYRASGTGHFELLAGLALLQKRKMSPVVCGDLMEAPESYIQEAALFHRFCEAAYTGPLLDFGRNPVLFPCAWLHRQGVLAPWTRSRRPVLEGDNWCRGHAAAFLKFVNLPPEALRKGRVNQRKREVAYFIVVLHDLKSVLIAVRGTETPEDLITDGLCRECNLSEDDLDGLIKGNHVPLGVRQTVLSTFPHYGHSGIVESVRELFKQIDGHPGEDDSSEKFGFLSSLLGNGCECHGYKLIIVGHSLGGAVATLLGVRLYARYPNLHVYAYGPLPCVDRVIAEACSDFVTSIVYNDEFSSRLSVNSILRLRAAAIAALSDDSPTDSAIINNFTRRILNMGRCHENGDNGKSPASSTQTNPDIAEDGNYIHKRRNLKNTINGGAFLCGHAVSCMVNTPDHCPSTRVVGITSEPGCHSEKGPYSSNQDLAHGLYEGTGGKQVLVDSPDDFLSFEGQTSALVDVAPTPIEVSVAEAPEVFLAGLIIHIVPEEKSASSHWKSWIVDDAVGAYRAFLADRQSFKDIVVSPFMFLDHLPWRCHYALQRVLETRKLQAQYNDDLLNGQVLV